jgi:hypothetical protein
MLIIFIINLVKLELDQHGSHNYILFFVDRGIHFIFSYGITHVNENYKTIIIFSSLQCEGVIM